MKITKTSSLIKRAASFITIIVGCIVLVGWLFNIPSFTSIFPGFGNMVPNTALCFILSGFALHLLKNAPSISSFRNKVAVVFTLLVLLIGSFSLSWYIFGWDVVIDRLFLNLIGIVDNYPGRMSLIVSLNFTLLGVVFLLLGKRKYHLLLQVLLIAMIPGSLLVIFNRVFGISFLTAIPLRAPTSMLTAILFIVLCIGVFLSPALNYIHFSFVKKIAVFFVLILLVRGTVFFAIDRNNQLAGDDDRWMSHNHKVILLTESLNDQSNDILSGARGYIIDGDGRFPLILSKTADSIKNIITNLQAIIKGNAVQQSIFDTLNSYLTAFLTSQNELVNIRRTEGFDSAQKMIRTGRGIVLLEKVHSFASAIGKQENQILNEHKAEDELIVRNSSRLFTLFQVIAALLMLAAFKMIYDHVRLRNKVEQALQQSLKETSDYKYALNESAIVAITDQKGIIRQVNDNFCKISKYSREELIGQDHRIINSAFHPKEFMRELWKKIANGEVWRGEIKNKAKDGTFYWVDTTIVPIFNESGKPCQYIAIRSDITHRKELEAEIIQMNHELQIRVEEKTKEVIEKEQQYRFLLQNMREGIQIIGFDWTYLFVNSSAAQHGKYANKELLGYTIMEKYPGIEKTKLFRVLQNCMKNRCPEVLENEFKFPDGSKRWFALSIQPVPEGLFVLSMDIDKRKKVEQQLQESERFLNESQEVSKIGSYVLDLNKGIWRGSHELDNIFGLPPNEEHTVDAWVSIIHPDDQAMMQAYFTNEVIGKKQRFDKEYKIINKKNKKEYWVHGIGELEYDSSGNLYRMLGTIQDIDAQKKMDDLLRRNELQFRSAFENSPHGMAIIDPNLRMKQVNESLCLITGYSKEELLLLRLEQITHPEDITKTKENFNEIIKKADSTWQHEIRYIHKQGHIIYILSCGSAIKEKSGNIINFVAQMQDITESKLLQQKINEEKKLLKTIIDNLPLNVYMKDLDSRKTLINKSELEYAGSKNEDDVLGKNDFDLYPPEFARISVDEDYEVFSTGKPIINKETKSVNKNGKEIWFLSSKIPFVNDLKKITGLLGISYDITQRKKLENELAEQKLKEQKLINEITIQTQEKERKELGRELHDNVNQILAIVKMYLGMLNAGEYSTEDNLLEKSYEYVNEAMKEIRKLSHSLVAPSLGNLGLKESLQILANDTNLLNGIKVQLVIDEKFNEEGIDKTKELMLYRVVQEQLNNITKYSKAEEAFITLKKENKTLFLTIADNGVGFDTNQKSNGGIGLTNMKSRIEFYSGSLNITSAPHEGCTLEISIPSA